MKIVMCVNRVLPFHDYGGAEMYVYGLSKYLIKNGVEVKIITSTPKGMRIKNTSYEGIKYQFISPHVTSETKHGFLLYHIFILNLSKKLSKENNFDLLHSYGMTAYDYLKRHKNGKRVIVQPFGLYGIGSSRVKESRISINRFFRKILIEDPLKYCLWFADAIAAEGDIQAKEIHEKYQVPKRKIFNIPDGVEIELIEEYIHDSKFTREYFNLEDADVILVNVNRLVENKGVNYLIEALKLLNEEINAKLILIGSGSGENAIKNQIKTLQLNDKVLHFKNISDKEKFQLINLADISVTPTLFEGLPIVILEAMSCGKPIVASNVTEVPQVVKHGLNGFLVPPRSSNEIAKAVLEIYDRNLITRMGRMSKKIVKGYDWNVIAKKVIKKYEKLI